MSAFSYISLGYFYMKKICICIGLAMVFLCAFCACAKQEAGTSTESNPVSLANDASSAQNENESAAQTQTATPTRSDNITKTDSPTTGSVEESSTGTGYAALDKLMESESVTYYCDDPNNRYICAVADAYGVYKSTLVALIRVNAQNPGATVLGFSGKTDADGNLLMTESELDAVYEVLDGDSTVKKATGKATGNVGYNYIASVTVFKLTKQFILPTLDDLRTERPYNGE